MDPVAARRRCVEALHALELADGAASYVLGDSGRGPTVFLPTAIGSDAVLGTSRRSALLENRPLVGQLADLRRASRQERSRMMRVDELMGRRTFEQSAFFQAVFAPGGMRDQMRMVIADGNDLVGWLGLLRSRGTSLFQKEDSQRVAPLVPRLARCFLAAHRMSEAQPADLLLDADGSIAFASRKAREWLDAPGFRDALAAATREADHERSQLAVGTAWVELVRVHGDGGTRYLARVQGARVLAMHPFSKLTLAQREVVEMAATGVTVPEIAAETGRSPGTVRAHLKRAYATLGVSTRSELVRLSTER